MKNTKYLSIGLAGLIAFSPMVSVAVGNETVLINEDKEVISEREEAVDYIEYKGKITDISKDEKNNMSIKVDGADKAMQNKIIFHIREDMTILSEKTKEFIGRNSLKEGDEITAFYKENTPMTMSIPAQLTPDVIVVNDSSKVGFVEVSHFNSELVNIKNELKLNISDDTVLVDIDGDKVDKEDLEDSDLMVFYTITTRSIPAQTTPEKVVVLANIDKEKIEDEITVMDKVILKGKELKLEDELSKTDDGYYMFAIRQISESLGYKVTWNNDERSATLTKDNQWSKVTIGKDDYNFAKMIVRLGKAPEIKDSKTYVPVKFLEEALQLEVDVEDGILKVK
jgi:copper amine oxidase-like protein